MKQMSGRQQYYDRKKQRQRTTHFPFWTSFRAILVREHTWRIYRERTKLHYLFELTWEASGDELLQAKCDKVDTVTQLTMKIKCKVD